MLSVSERITQAFLQACKRYDVDQSKMGEPSQTVMGWIWRHYDKAACISRYIEVQEHKDTNGLEVIFHEVRKE